MWPSAAGNLKTLNHIKEKGKLGDSLSSHMGGNWELVLLFSQFVLRPSLCGCIFLQAPQKGADHHTAGGCLAWIPALDALQNTCTQPIGAIHSQGSMKGNKGTSVQNQRLHLGQQCSIKALTRIQAIQKPQPSISGQQSCSQGRLMHPKFQLQLLIG